MRKKTSVTVETSKLFRFHQDYAYCRSPLSPCLWNDKTLLLNPQKYREKTIGRFRRLQEKLL